MAARHQRYQQNQRSSVAGMRALGFNTLLDDELHSPIITAFYSPEDPQYRFSEFYRRLKEQGFVIYLAKCRKATASASAILAKYMPPISLPC